MHQSKQESAIFTCLRVWRWSIPVALLLSVLAALRAFSLARINGDTLTLHLALEGQAALSMFWGLVAPVVLWLIELFPLHKRLWLKSACAHFLSCVGLGSVFTIYAWFITTTMYQRISISQYFATSTAAVMICGATQFYIPTLVAGYIALYYRWLREQEFHSSRLAGQLGDAHLRLLRMQLHPHFLFNTLHSISTLIYTDPRSADKMIARLSDLLRVTLESPNLELVPLREELDYVSKYLMIEQIRFSDRLQIGYDIERGSLEAAVPHLILQPLVENAVQHGISKVERKGRIDIKAKISGSTLNITVSDSGPGFSNGWKGHGLGLRNTRARLQQAYGSAANLDVRINGAVGATVSLSLPLAAEKCLHTNGNAPLAVGDEVMIGND
jgi:two-component system LytT family sensor kinase